MAAAVRTVEVTFTSNVDELLAQLREVEASLERIVDLQERVRPVSSSMPVTLAQGRPHGYVTRTSGDVLPERGYTIA